MASGNRRALLVFEVIIYVVLFGGASEFLLRVLNPQPRVQMIRKDMLPIRVLHGEPVFVTVDTPEHQNEGCPSEGTLDVAMFGSSIFYSTPYTYPQSLAARLQKRLDAGGEGRCVIDYAQPAHTFDSKLALAKDAIPRFQPEIVLWEVWMNDPGGYTLIDGDAYNLTGLELDGDGYPIAIPLPGPIHRALFRHSRLYWYGTLSVSGMFSGTKDYRDKIWDDVLAEGYPELLRLTRAAGSRLVLVLCPPLDHGFAESADQVPVAYQKVLDFAAANGIEALILADALRDEDFMALRGDPCCHYNEDGLEAVADVLEAAVNAGPEGDYPGAVHRTP